ncbi:hypothetical protein EG329_003742 [Mollisiaceae sp. DMI_Dod_QoI]|nr:hypothetical protein EG329_003742 [Helotiales sp. DMI_Dod_QoI]
MDAAEDDQDVKLERASADLLADFQSSLQPFLWKNTKSGRKQIRNRVRVRDTARLVNLLEPFQELPQLLDPHLDKFVPALADAFLASLQAPTPKHAATNTQLLMPVQIAICKLLYTFCKIRGDKVIVRFWSTETRYLELLLTAIESNQVDSAVEDENAPTWEWEERYITLLWLSQLLLAPFDLASISSRDTEDVMKPRIPGLLWPPNLPTITLRAISLGIKYLSSSGKERDAAKTLLVRIAMRRDMQTLGVQDALIQWTITCLHITADPDRSIYHYIGVLSFIAGILISSVGTTNMDRFINQISRVIQSIIQKDVAVFKVIRGSDVARKATVKILRTIVVLLLQGSDLSSNAASEMIEFTISHMLDSLADSATPVRLAASKALSIITLKLPSDMATQVVEAVLQSLDANVLSVKKPGSEVKMRNLARVNPLEWHGLTLTLSHLLYRQSIAPEDLAPVLDALRLALSFEQRSTSGSSLGTNVRDAACFGIWAVARRYKTADLQAFQLSSNVIIRSNFSDEAGVSALQTLANDLVVSACVDPAGNIRRGASAALQELIGRHPNTISEGIQVVQVVDYHAVALRTRAMKDVAIQASQLSEEYHRAILEALLGWRGVRDVNPSARRNAAFTIGTLVWQQNFTKSGSWLGVQSAISNISKQIGELEQREINERHGLILAFAAVVTEMNPELSRDKVHVALHEVQNQSELISSVGSMKIDYAVLDTGKGSLYNTIVEVNSHLVDFLKDFKDQVQNSRHMELLAEAFCELATATYGIIQVLDLYEAFSALKGTITEDFSQCPPECWVKRLVFGKHKYMTPRHSYLKFHKSTLEVELNLIKTFVKYGNPGNFDTLSDAASGFVLLEISRFGYCHSMVPQWIIDIMNTRGKKGLATLHVLIQLLPVLPDMCRPTIIEAGVVEYGIAKDLGGKYVDNSERRWQPLVLGAIKYRWSNDHDVDTRATILQSLAQSSALRTHTSNFVDMVKEGLQDFTTNARGDVGSLVRIAAAKAATVLGTLSYGGEIEPVIKAKVVGAVLRTAAEKLDKVRIEGQRAVAQLIKESSFFLSLAPSSQQYFASLLSLQLQEWWKSCPESLEWATNLLEGYVTSADTGSEDLIRASRGALVEFCNNGYGDLICHQLFALTMSKVDRVLIPTLEVIGFLFDMQIMQKSSLNWNIFYNTIQGAHYKSSNVRKLHAVVKIYGGLIEVYPDAVTKLSSMLLHNYPRIQNAAADELWVAKGVGKGVDWCHAKRVDLERVRKEMSQVV